MKKHWIRCSLDQNFSVNFLPLCPVSYPDDHIYEYIVHFSNNLIHYKIIYIISAQSINSAYAPSYTNLKDLRVCNKEYYTVVVKIN